MSKTKIQIVERFRVNRTVRVLRFQSEFSRYHEGVTFMGLRPQFFRDPGLMTCEIIARFSENAKPSRILVSYN